MFLSNYVLIDGIFQLITYYSCKVICSNIFSNIFNLIINFLINLYFIIDSRGRQSISKHKYKETIISRISYVALIKQELAQRVSLILPSSTSWKAMCFFHFRKDKFRFCIANLYYTAVPRKELKLTPGEDKVIG